MRFTPPDPPMPKPPLPAGVKLAVGMLVAILVLQAAAPIAAIFIPISDPVDDKLGGYPNPWIASYSCFSCATIPLILINVLGTMATMCTSCKTNCNGRAGAWLCGVIIANAFLMAAIFMLFILAQISFVPPEGSS